MKSNNKNIKIIGIILVLLLFLGGIFVGNNDPSNPNNISSTISTILEEVLGYETPVDENADGTNEDTGIPNNQESAIDVSDIPEFSGTPYITINNNIPDFSASDYTTTSYEKYSELDSLGRCGVAMASIGTDLMPTEERGSIGHVNPT